MVRFDLHTGLRKGELVGLRWSDLDLKNKVLTIPAARAKGKRDRHVSLNRTALGVLEDLRKATPQLRPESLVFGNAKGKQRVSFHKEWRKALHEAGISDFTFHGLRHTYASRLAMAGRPLTEIMRLMGHQSYELTLRYSHLSPTSLQEAVETLDRPNPEPSVDLTGINQDQLQ
jgi:integrase